MVRGMQADPRSPRLWVEGTATERRYWSETVGAPPSVYGERWVERDGRALRAWGPARSKLSAALGAGWEGPLPREGQRWLYLGAATGTTASHVADLVGPTGAVFAVEKSARPFQKLLALAQRWENLRPLFADARSLPADSYAPSLVDGLYADLPQPDQVEIVLRCAQRFVKEPGCVLMALKTASMGRELSAPAHLEAAEMQLARFLTLERTVRLAPWHRGHYLVGGVVRSGFEREEVAVSSPPGPRVPGRSSPRPRPEGHAPARPSGRGTERWGPRPVRRGRNA